jgi:hypothetical protein
MQTRSFEFDLGYLQSALEELESYLFSDEVFWPLNAGPAGRTPPYPRLTLGGLLLARARLEAYSLSVHQEALKQEVITDIDRLRSKWRARWEMKAGRCYSTRLRMWADFWDEYRSNPQENVDRYRYEVRLRVMLQLLRIEGGGRPPEVELLAGLDQGLRPVLKMDTFIWEPEVRRGFPVDEYWYLYGRLPRFIVNA